MILDQGMDPADLPDGTAEFSQTILGITFHGSAKVFNGYFRGWSGLRRTGGTSLAFDAVSNFNFLSLSYLRGGGGLQTNLYLRGRFKSSN
jgi:hypothetical protein